MASWTSCVVMAIGSSVLVRYEPGTSRGERATVRRELDAELERRLLVPRLELLALGPADSVGAAVTAL